MGKVKVDLYSKDMKYSVYTLSDIKVVELLIRFRYKYDPYMYSQPNNNFTQAGDVEPMNVEAIALFQDLDRLIETSDLNERQKTILNMVQEGYSISQIAEKLKLKSHNTVSLTFKASCRKIVKRNIWDWRKVIYINTLGLISKKCSKCQEYLPITDEFFSDNKYSKDSYHSQCKTCRS